MSVPVTAIRGIGPAVADLLQQQGISSVHDLLAFRPRRYEDRSRFVPLDALKPGVSAVICAVVQGVQTRYSKRSGLAVTTVRLRDAGGEADAPFFGQAYIANSFRDLARSGSSIVAWGSSRLSRAGGVWFDVREWEPWDPEGDPLSVGRLVPIYPALPGVSQKRLRRWMLSALDLCAASMPEALPRATRVAQRLLPVEAAWRNLHFPASAQLAESARVRLAFEELLVLQLRLARLRHARGAAGRVSAGTDTVITEMQQALGFTFTQGQSEATAALVRGMAAGRSLHGLLQGDVGSGKTAVCLAAALAVLRSGSSVALMAPTEVLAVQHYRKAQAAFAPLGIGVGLMAGGRSEAPAGEGPSLLVGTHALIFGDGDLRGVGLVIVDEQHRFGVQQREALRARCGNPHLLVTTATPIPRSLALALYGDLDVVALRELPPGRSPVRTHWRRPSQRDQVYAGVAEVLRRGRQAYVVCPAIDADGFASVTATAVRLQQGALVDWTVGELHGRVPVADRDAVLARFRDGKIDVLVATTLVEVGVDVPNAAVMVIEDADRFGLAQLHQLRGRVGRGAHASYCVLIAEPATEQGASRMEALVGTNDGFEIAEADLLLRGAGELDGVRQSGASGLRFADLAGDGDLLERARRLAQGLMRRDPELSQTEHRLLAEALRGQACGGPA
jgi:ATP-dependent DNA helicase RecG